MPAYNQSVGNGNATYWLNEANVSYLTGSYEHAAESYAKAVNLDPSLSEGWLNLGNSLYFLGRYQASLNAYDTSLKLEPQNADALAGKNQALLALNNTLGPNNSTRIPSTVQ
jgi:tetratricopeptide (TPR) repeat protein